MFSGELSPIVLGIDNTLDTLESYPGYIGDLEWWNSYIPETQVYDYFTNGPDQFSESLMGYWKFNSGEGDLFFPKKPASQKIKEKHFLK